jgi:phosphate/sulfate permease
VSFSHGANDGQKGIGLIMLVLIGVAPAGFVVNMNASGYDITRTRDAVNNVEVYFQQHPELAEGNGRSATTADACGNSGNTGTVPLSSEPRHYRAGSC